LAPPPSATGVETALALAAFLAPGVALAVVALVKGRGNARDGASRLLTELSQGYFQPDVGGESIPVAEGELSDLAGDEPLFKALFGWFLQSGGVYKLVFGPKAFVVISDPVVVRHILRDNAMNYDKGVLAEILEPIMGKGLIPADLETWKVRRRAIVPAFHKAYYESMARMFASCTERTVEKLDKAIEAAAVGKGSGGSSPSPPSPAADPPPAVVDMEAEFLSLGLDIIGLGVFNYDFGSITSESPVIKAVYGVLKEAEHRSTFYLPYWNVALLRWLVPRQRKFAQDLQVINATLDGLISEAIASRTEEDAEALQQRDYSRVRDPSLLRFLVDARGEDATAKQLRDDLMTMLIAGHETTAAVLTWTLFCLAQHPEEAKALRDEVDSVLADGRDPGIDDIRSLPRVRAALAESLRLYPQPPLLIRRALNPDTLPSGLNGAPEGYPIGKGADLFISVWNLHHSPHLWKDPEAFRPGRFSEQFSNPAFNGEWAGYRPDSSPGAMYPNEITSDFAFLPFGGGARKCVGDQFAFFEAVIALAMLLRRFDFELAVKPEEVGMATGATIHTRDGLKMRVSRRNGRGGSVAAAGSAAAEAAAAPAAG
jgi:cytochrome P450